MHVKLPTLEELSKYRCYFFDFDGVVLESGNIKTEAFLELYDGLGISKQVKKHHLENQGVSRYDKFRWIAENLLGKEYSDEMGIELGIQFSKLVKAKVIAAPFVQGFEKLIKYLNEKTDSYCVIASGTPQNELAEIVQERRLSKYFHEVYGSPKTKDQIVLEVTKRKEFEPRQCLFFGDASTDYEAAEATGLDFYARLSSELKDFWAGVDYKFGTLDFEEIR